MTTTERPLILATFKTPLGEISARVQRTPDGVFAMARMADYPDPSSDRPFCDAVWTLVRDGDGDGIEWQRNGVTVAPPSDDEVSPNVKNALRNATWAMFVWVMP